MWENNTRITLNFILDLLSTFHMNLREEYTIHFNALGVLKYFSMHLIFNKAHRYSSAFCF